MDLSAFHYLMDEMILVASERNKFINFPGLCVDICNEQHATYPFTRGFYMSLPWQDRFSGGKNIHYAGNDVLNVLNIVSKTDMVSIVPRLVAAKYFRILGLKIVELPHLTKKVTCYLSWQGLLTQKEEHYLMSALLAEICQQKD